MIADTNVFFLDSSPGCCRVFAQIIADTLLVFRPSLGDAVCSHMSELLWLPKSSSSGKFYAEALSTRLRLFKPSPNLPYYAHTIAINMERALP